MKKFLKKIVLLLLSCKARKILNSDTKIIAVTGSMGKTTAKNAICHVLSKKYNVRASQEGFNTEIGVLLTVLGEQKSGFSSFFKWLVILLRVLFTKVRIPDIIVLEFGVDTPGDMKSLLDIVRPDYAVVTNVAPVHLATGQFTDIEQIAMEKMTLPVSLPSSGIAIVNFESEYIRKFSDKIHAEVISYSQYHVSSLRITHPQQLERAIVFGVEYKGESMNYTIPFFGTYHYMVLTPAIILAYELGIPLQESAEYLKQFTAPPGRGKILEGIGGSIIWDASYNSSPPAAMAALETLRHIPARRRLALLGNMNELGKYSHQYHEQLGKSAAEYADEVFFVGKEAEAFQNGFSGTSRLKVFTTAEDAGEYIKTILQENDVLLVKGSQNGVFLERAVKKLLAHEADVRYLCRQTTQWKRKE